jgi:prephenate dehydrogenase
MGNTVTIIGAAGKMGKWFFDYFNSIKKSSATSKNNGVLFIDKILLYDINEINYAFTRIDEKIAIVNNLSESLKISDIVVFCTPINVIIEIINCNVNSFKSGSIIVEISSIKSSVHKILSDISTRKNIVTLCVHPMFGPGASVDSTNKIILVPVNKNNRNVEQDILNKIFSSYEKIIIEDPEKHDLAISVIISLIYFINLVFSKLLIDLSSANEFRFEENIIQFFKKISGSTFKMQSLLSESILTDDVSLFLALFVNNDKSFLTFKKYNQIFIQLLDKVEKNDQKSIKDFIMTTKNSIKKEIDINNSYDILYKFLNS